MAIADNRDLAQYCRETAERARNAASLLSQVRGDAKNLWLKASASRLREQSDPILAANQDDLAQCRWDVTFGHHQQSLQVDAANEDCDPAL